jgi:hypothetical protein
MEFFGPYHLEVFGAFELMELFQECLVRGFGVLDLALKFVNLVTGLYEAQPCPSGKKTKAYCFYKDPIGDKFSHN